MPNENKTAAARKRMGLTDVLKDVVTIAQKIDNIDLCKKLLEANQLAMELQSELIIGKKLKEDALVEAVT